MFVLLLAILATLDPAVTTVLHVITALLIGYGVYALFVFILVVVVFFFVFRQIRRVGLF